ncbi:hypothetical protein CBR_g4517 [Chara braunii]|uniref:Myb/SANT-like DNA-binding domain-containing protein n=1 Tax=Chara braunii TaxID=69332 RepID=A0A388KI44_CHABU|nr:hypothetical protein CBR_g4517 [Chara braunii]|eukprot:GBG69687.1 hypothetical protein CBR_g4517 [Chara braunii]
MGIRHIAGGSSGPTAGVGDHQHAGASRGGEPSRSADRQSKHRERISVSFPSAGGDRPPTQRQARAASQTTVRQDTFVCNRECSKEEPAIAGGTADTVMNGGQRSCTIVPSGGGGGTTQAEVVATTADRRKGGEVIGATEEKHTVDVGGTSASRRRYDRIADRMKEEGYVRTGEDCRKKWAELHKKVREIRDACEGSGKKSYWDLTTDEGKKLNISQTFERPLWDAMEWYRLKAIFTMDNTMASEDLRGSGSALGSKAGFEGGGTEASDSAPKTRRSSSGRVREGESAPTMSSMATTMEV